MFIIQFSVCETLWERIQWFSEGLWVWIELFHLGLVRQLMSKNSWFCCCPDLSVCRNSSWSPADSNRQYLLKQKWIKHTCMKVVSLNWSAVGFCFLFIPTCRDFTIKMATALQENPSSILQSIDLSGNVIEDRGAFRSCYILLSVRYEVSPVQSVLSAVRWDKTRPPPNEASWHHPRTDVVSRQFRILGRIVNHSVLVNGQNPSDFGEEL